MQWDDSPNAGFAAPQVKDLWLPLAPDYKQRNVETELQEPRSMLNFFRNLLALRKSSPALVWGQYSSVELDSAESKANCFVFTRQAEGEQMLVALNFSGEEQNLSLPRFGTGRIILSTMMDRMDEVDLGTFTLRPNEGCIIGL
jgi:alpha-glucosidase